MDSLKEMLQEIQKGRTEFIPKGQSVEDMQDFQPIAKMLLYANNEGFLESYLDHKESETAHNFYDFILVKGGLSYQGELYLNDAKNESTKSPEEIIQIKPNFFGISVDIKAFWKRYIAK